MARIFPDKKKIKIYIPTEDSVNLDGSMDKPLDEQVPKYLSRASDYIIKPKYDNNTMICMGRDRWYQEKKNRIVENKTVLGLRENDSKDPSRRSLVSGYSDHQGAGAIDIVVGRCAPYPYQISSKVGPLYTTEDESKKDQSEISAVFLKDQQGNPTPHPGIVMDAARIYITQMSDIDRYFGIENLQPVCRGEDKPSSAIVLKADRVRMHSRRDIKIIAGGDGDRDSNGYLINESPKIHLIAGNGKLGNQQPVALGKNLLKCLQRMHECQQNILEVVNNLMTSQLALNTVVSNSIRVSPAGPTATDPVSQAMVTLKNFSDVNDMFNIYFEKFWNIPTDEFSYLNASNADFILSRNVTVN